MALCYGLNIWVVPASYHRFRQYEFEIRNKMAAFLLQEGVFTPVSDTMTVYIRTRDPDGTLRGILVEDDRQKNTRATILAQSGHLESSGDVPRVVLYNGSREEIDRKTGRLNVLTFGRNTIDLTDSGKDDDIHYRDASEMSLGELLHPDPHAVMAHDRGKFLVEANRRLTAPLTAFSFAMVALLSVLGGAFSRHGALLRPLVAILAVVGLLAVGLTVQSVASRAPALIPLIWIEAVLPGLVCAGVLFGTDLRAPAASRRGPPAGTPGPGPPASRRRAPVAA